MAGNFPANVRKEKATAARRPGAAIRPHRKPKAPGNDVAGGGHFPESGADFLVYVRLKKLPDCHLARQAQSNAPSDKIRPLTIQTRTTFDWIADLLYWCNAISVGVTLGVTRIFRLLKPLCHKRFHHLFD